MHAFQYVEITGSGQGIDSCDANEFFVQSTQSQQLSSRWFLTQNTLTRRATFVRSSTYLLDRTLVPHETKSKPYPSQAQACFRAVQACRLHFSELALLLPDKSATQILWLYKLYRMPCDLNLASVRFAVRRVSRCLRGRCVQSRLPIYPCH